MKIVRVSVPGGPSALEIVEVAAPNPGVGELRVLTKAIGVGRPDVLIRNGTYKWMPALPATPGSELAGIVDAVGPGGDPAWIGKRVLISSRELPHRGGCYAEQLLVPADAPFVLLDSITFEQAVSLPNFQTADALLNQSHGSASVRNVLITGAAGGVASAISQLARHQDIEVIGVVSSKEKAAFAEDNGVTSIVRRDLESISSRVMELTGGRGVDLALDPLGSTIFIECLRSLAPLGTLVSYNVIAGLPADVFKEMRALLTRSLAVRCFSMHMHDDDREARRVPMQRLMTMMADGHIRAPAPTVIPMAEVRSAHEILDAGDTVGKIILKP